MATDVQDMKLEVVKEQDLAAQIAETKGHVNHLALEVSLLREQIRTSVSSRRGVEGPRGERGETGHAGKDAVIRIVQVDGKIKVLDTDGRVQAEIVAVPGPVGAQGPRGEKGDSIIGPKGDPGVSPSLDEVVAAVVKAISSRLA
jgi:hypothetical protein